MITKPIDTMTLEELNEEIEFAGEDKKFTRVDHARSFVKKLIKSGKVKISEEAAEQSDVKPAEPKSKKVKEPKVPKEKPVYNFGPTDYEGRRVFVSGGAAKILAYDPEAKRFQVEMIHSGKVKDAPESSVRWKAVDEKYRERYIKSGVRTESGAESIHNGDELAQALEGLTALEIKALAKENGLEAQNEVWEARKVNNGMRRMSLSNILRGKIRRGEPVTIFGEADLKEAASKNQAKMVEEKKKAEAEKAERAKARAEAEKERKAKRAEKAKEKKPVVKKGKVTKISKEAA